MRRAARLGSSGEGADTSLAAVPAATSCALMPRLGAVRNRFDPLAQGPSVDYHRGVTKDPGEELQRSVRRMWRKGARALIEYRKRTKRAGRASTSPQPRSISCIICAYNEADRIEHVLKVVSRHPLLHEIIVVDDGSTDGTIDKAAAFADVTIVSLWPNGGKSRALATGVAAAGGDYVMLLDADLVGLTAADVSALAAPVLEGEADSTISLRGDSLGVYRAMGLDFVSGERVLPRALFGDPAKTMAALPRWGCEVFINEGIIAMGLRVAVVEWRHVFHTPKHRKVGAWRGVTEELRMVGDALRVISPAGVLRQHVELKRLSRSA